MRLILALGLLLAGCAGSPSSQQLAEQKAHDDAEDDATCISYGTKPGAASYTQCRLALMQMRQDRKIAYETNRARIKAAIIASP